MKSTPKWKQHGGKRGLRSQHFTQMRLGCEFWEIDVIMHTWPIAKCFRRQQIVIAIQIYFTKKYYFLDVNYYVQSVPVSPTCTMLKNCASLAMSPKCYMSHWFLPKSHSDQVKYVTQCHLSHLVDDLICLGKELACKQMKQLLHVSNG